MSFLIESGELVGLVGENGAGKSTIMRLCLGLYRPQKGSVLWDGVDVSSISLKDVAARSAVLMQNFTRFELTLAENVSFASSDDPAVLPSLAMAEVDLAKFPQGVSTRLTTRFAIPGVSQRGKELSGGLWQRVALARLMHRTDASFVVADEPTSALDPLHESRLAHMIAEFSTGKAGLLITHRLGILTHVDRILLLSEGRIVGSGTHRELLEASNLYRTLYESQSSQYESLNAR